MLHAVYLQDGTARYRNRWIESKGLLAERARGQACYGGMSNFQLPPDDVMQEGGLLKNTANTATVRHAGRYFSLMEAALPTEFDRDLRTLGECDFGGRLDGPFTAHPKVDPVTGDMIFFGYSATAPFLRYHEVDASGELVHSADIDLPAGVMMHDFAITERYAIFFDSPAVFDLDALLAGDPPMSWRPDNGTRIGVMPRRGTSSDIRWFEIDNCYVVHFSNAWDAADTIEVRAPRMPDMPGGFEAEPGPAREPMPWKWTLDLTTGRVVDEQTDDVPGEFPASTKPSPGIATGTATTARPAAGTSTSTSTASCNTTTSVTRRPVTPMGRRRSAVSMSSPPTPTAAPRTTGG